MTKREAIRVLQIDEDFLYKDDNPRNRAAYRMAREAIKRTQWIPVSERLPERHGEPYYVGFDTELQEAEELYESDMVLVCCKVHHKYVFVVSQVIYSKEPDGFATEWYGLYDYAEQEINDRDVIAWMPLPEPYGGDE